MLDELPGLAKRIKDFVRENDPRDRDYFLTLSSESREGFAVRTADLLRKAAIASRQAWSFRTENLSLSIAELKSYENRVNRVPLSIAPGSGIGLVRVVGFEFGPDNFCTPNTGQRPYVKLEYSPLGWPDLPDMAEADLNVLFRETSVEPIAIAIDPADVGRMRIETKDLAQCRREWGFA